jgi:hypothetical protein
MEEAQQQLDQIKALAILLADKIKRLSNAYVRGCDGSPEDSLIIQNSIEELTTQEVMNSIKLLLENDSFFWITQHRGFFQSSLREILSWVTGSYL